MLRLVDKLFGKNRGLVIGGSGEIGSAVVSAFRKRWEITNVDLKQNPLAHTNIIIDQAQDIEIQYKQVEEKLSGKYDMIICTAGGWCSGDIENPNIFSQMELNLRTNLYPNLLASYISTKFLTELGLLVHTGEYCDMHSSWNNQYCS